MKIVVTMTQVPFIEGGAEYLAQNLVTALEKANHDVELVNIPMVETPVELLEDQIAAARLLEIVHTFAGRSDLCIGLKFPAYFIRHPNKVIWALHQYRGAYELWGTSYAGMHHQAEGERMRKVITNADNLYLREAKRIYTISGNVSARLMAYNNIPSTPLFHPCPDMEKFYCNEYDDYILMPSRINAAKRQKLAVEAMTYTKSKIKLIIVGRAEQDTYFNDIRQIIAKNNLEDRVKILDFVSREKKLELYANAGAVLFIPFDEDYGYITLEGMSASKPVITATDSGGPLAFVKTGKTGFVISPDAAEIAKAIDEIAGSKSLAVKLGRNAKKYITDMDITWDNVVKELTL